MLPVPEKELISYVVNVYWEKGSARRKVRQTGKKRIIETSLVSPGPALVANSLCSGRTGVRCKPEGQSGNSGLHSNFHGHRHAGGIATPSATISVVIGVWDEGPALRKVLDALASQDLKPIEIVVVDNASSDDTRAVAQHQGAKIVEIPKGEFTYGKALNAGIRQTSGEFVCILSAHSLPIGPDFLRNALAPFADPTIAAVRLLSIANRTELENWAKRTILERPVEIETVISSAPLNAAAMIRRVLWEQIPYDETLTSVEDKFWALAMLLHF